MTRTARLREYRLETRVRCKIGDGQADPAWRPPSIAGVAFAFAASLILWAGIVWAFLAVWRLF